MKRTQPHSWLAASIIACALGSSGCSADERENVDVEQQQQPILEGVTSTEPSVLFLAVDRDLSDSRCSAVVIAPTLVVTARHCVSMLYNPDWPLTCDSSMTRYFDDLRPYRLGVYADGVFLAEGRRIIRENRNDECSADFAVVELATPLAVTPMPIDYERALQKGDALEIDGYGRTSTRPGLATHNKRDVTVESTSPERIFTSTGACRGDSGGALIARSEQGPTLVGVIAGGSFACSGSVVHVPAARMKDVITRALHEVAIANDPNANNSDASIPTSVVSAPAPATASDEGGCSIGGAGSSSISAWPALLVAAIFAARRRRRGWVALVALSACGCSSTNAASPSAKAADAGTSETGGQTVDASDSVYVSEVTPPGCIPLTPNVASIPEWRPLRRAPGRCTAAEVSAFAKACGTLHPWWDTDGRCYDVLNGDGVSRKCVACATTKMFDEAWSAIIVASSETMVPNVAAVLRARGASEACANAVFRSMMCDDAACTCSTRSTVRAGLDCRNEAATTVCSATTELVKTTCTADEQRVLQETRTNWDAILPGLVNEACGDGAAVDAGPG